MAAGGAGVSSPCFSPLHHRGIRRTTTTPPTFKPPPKISISVIFDMRCLHIPIMDRTPFAELVKQVERTVRSENYRSPNRPIYLVGESLGGCLALAVAARNPDIDLILILANPATCFGKSQLQHLIPFLEIMPEQLHLSVPYVMSSFSGIPLRMVMATVEKGLPLQQTVGEISQGVIALSSYLSVRSNICM
ncbi:hypothetical protein TEA_013094 [Camellia sinensis var. sinensis]|uniref:Serine aminopeptidase S33 domain-containing protein n=1 Tax=Camellia sinensis var. sinensis TaxID=542762 RepID=A0A4S4D4R0_CAMSN|nr:hypothetical protein TEA_013094 [Camellia sinensis var. sinensis]